MTGIAAKAFAYILIALFVLTWLSAVITRAQAGQPGQDENDGNQGTGD